MVDVECAGISDFIEKVLELRTVWFPSDPWPDLWFRGSENRDLKLLPGAYWRSRCDERSLVLTFQNSVPSYLSREPTDEWEWYYLMQHYGVPTRLLDWTESPFVALYFALAKPPAGEGPCVWALDPVALNRVAQGFEDNSIVAPLPANVDSPSHFWLPRFCVRNATPRAFPRETGWRDNSKPLAVFPKRYNARIVAQRGVFTIHGTEEIAIDDLMATEPDNLRIQRFLFSSDLRERLRRDLHCLGVSKSALFPEPQSVADDLKLAYRVDGAV